MPTTRSACGSVSRGWRGLALPGVPGGDHRHLYPGGGFEGGSPRPAPIPREGIVGVNHQGLAAWAWALRQRPPGRPEPQSERTFGSWTTSRSRKQTCGGKVASSGSLRRHYPDQVQRVCSGSSGSGEAPQEPPTTPRSSCAPCSQAAGSVYWTRYASLRPGLPLRRRPVRRLRLDPDPPVPLPGSVRPRWHAPGRILLPSAWVPCVVLAGTGPRASCACWSRPAVGPLPVLGVGLWLRGHATFLMCLTPVFSRPGPALRRPPAAAGRNPLSLAWRRPEPPGCCTWATCWPPAGWPGTCRTWPSPRPSTSGGG
jgi:hypothetical protein